MHRHPLVTFPFLPRVCRAPSVALVNGSTTASSAVVAVTPPAGTAAATFDKFLLTACLAGTSTNCLARECLPANVAACSITGLSSGQAYTVFVEAVKGAAKSVRSGPASFTTRYR